MAGSRWAALAVAATIAAGGAGCGDDETVDVARIGVVTPGARDDVDWTRQTVAAVERAAHSRRVEPAIVDGSKAGHLPAALRRLAQTTQLVVALHPQDRAEAVRIAEAEGTPVLVRGDPQALREGAVGDVEVDWEGGAYAAGFLSSHASYFRSAGIVVCDDDDAETLAVRFAMAAAFAAGARADEPRIELAYVRVAANPSAASRGVMRLLRQRMQMVFALCGAETRAAVDTIERARERPGLFWDETHLVTTVGDKATLADDGILTSVLVDPTSAIERAVRDLRTGNFGRRVYRLDAANGGIALLSTGRTPSDALELAIDAGRAVHEDRSLLPGIATEAALRAYIAGE